MILDSFKSLIKRIDRRLLFLALLLGLLLLFSFVQLLFSASKKSNIGLDFAYCLKNGGAVTQTYPRTCALDNITYKEEVARTSNLAQCNISGKTYNVGDFVTYNNSVCECSANGSLIKCIDKTNNNVTNAQPVNDSEPGEIKEQRFCTAQGVKFTPGQNYFDGCTYCHCKEDGYGRCLKRKCSKTLPPHLVTN